jgi:hypothetical protein
MFMRSIGTGNGTVAHLFKSASHDPSDSDEESDDSALEDVKLPPDEPTEIIGAERSLVIEEAREEPSPAKEEWGEGWAAVRGSPRLEPEIETGYYKKGKSKKSKKRVLPVED